MFLASAVVAVAPAVTFAQDRVSSRRVVRTPLGNTAGPVAPAVFSNRRTAQATLPERQLPQIPAPVRLVADQQVAVQKTGIPPNPRSPVVKVSAPLQRLEIITQTSRTLSLEKKIPRAQVDNPEIIKLRAISPTQVNISAKKPGFTQVYLWDEDERVHTIEVIVYPDAREFHKTLEILFPTTSLKVVPLQNSVFLEGYVQRPEQVNRIVDVASQYYPKVINNLKVAGVQQVLLNVKVMEVSRTKLRAMGFDFAAIDGADFFTSTISRMISAGAGGAPTALGGDTMRFGLVDGNSSFFGFLEFLQQRDLAKILAEPKIVTVSGRPAYFNVGGEFPILVPQSLGSVSIEYKRFGTQVDFVPIVLGNGRIRLEVRPRVSEIDASRGVTVQNITVPGLRVREVDTGVEMRAGQTLALAGLIQNRVEAQNRSVPLVGDIPGPLGAMFRRVEEEINEIELLILVTPELVDALEPHEVQELGPGMHSVSPMDKELYWQGKLEVYPCCPDESCQQCQNGHAAAAEPAARPAAQPASVPQAAAPRARLAPIRGQVVSGGSGYATDSGGVSAVRPASAVMVRPRATGSIAPPGLIGPVGYDVQQR